MSHPEHFFVVGAQRSGTTYLYHVLDEHPQIEMARPMRPEPKFFVQNDFAQQSPADYEDRYFSGNTPLRGEKSTSYYETELAAQRIATWYPDAPLIFLLRNPIERAISNYRFSQSNGIEPLLMDEAFHSEQTRDYDRTRFSVSPYTYLRRGRYIDYLRMYEQYFPREQLLVYFYEELVENLAVIQDLYRALGADDDFWPPSLRRVANASENASPNLDEDLYTFLSQTFSEPNAELAGYLGRPLPW